MDVRINEVQSTVQTTDSQSLLDPRVFQDIVRACVRAVKEDQAHEKRLNDERRLDSGSSSDHR